MKLLNGQPSEMLPLADRGLQFGDGVFRTLRLEHGVMPFWSRHYAKLAADCAVLGLSCPAEALLLEDIRQLGVDSATIKIIITRGESARGYAIPEGCQANRIVQATGLPAYPAEYYSQGVAVRLCATRASWQPALAGVKHLNRLENVLARREWQDPAIFDGLLLDRDGFVVEGVLSNILLLDQQGRVLTPLLRSSGVAGVMRAIALELFAAQGYTVQEQEIPVQTLLAARQIWLSNSLFGLLPVRQLGERQWIVDPLDTLLQEKLQHAAENEFLRLELPQDPARQGQRK
ncbi:aminodeoxychorismate lyase [Chitinilyticum piscinae]|uniref:aminodeoxychorismate lyase n=1 Tax=Chitinilyticum piscinae TaxID=2866724 RepID=A0A8J7FMC8_9NEIS|nr:aminodeoxychorismate lyase [Chitinilyticum piscinae]MBE9610260.1 aminodeoxychorismate lyase [Chitinilyticum piscinae]